MATTGLKLYKSLLREARTFDDFNLRSYAVRRIQDGFRAGRQLAGGEAQAQLQVAQRNLALIRRQVTVHRLFTTGQRLSLEMTPRV
eukprot:maker-scaffold510_size151595-snap-gene-0.30 protein:Tk04747 transcript:maker-scaffold510_size151595-snap-gene-0.30-mRNA-1 annotation:"hypothetical protein AND_008074"